MKTFSIDITLAEAVAIVICRDKLPPSLVDKALKMSAEFIAETERGIEKFKTELDVIDRLSLNTVKRVLKEADTTD